MLKRLRIALLLYLLLFVAVGSYLARQRSTDWDQPLWVDVYPLAASRSPAAKAFANDLDDVAFAGIETFFAAQAADFGLVLDRPFRFSVAPPLERTLPPLPAHASWLDALVFSLRMRWLVLALQWRDERPTPDIVLFLVYHDPSTDPEIERSTALRKGLIAIANVFASSTMRGGNDVVIAHELLHTLGATDKYDPLTNLPSYPLGYADPEQHPLHPQRRAEIMAGRTPIGPGEATTPNRLADTVVGPATALEIGWIERLP